MKSYNTPPIWQQRVRERGFLRIGHKGASAYEPGNTLRSFERALALGVDMVEFDVRWSADRQLVLAHADELAELCHQSGRVSESTLGELRALDLGGASMATLDEALELLAGKTLLNVDLKVLGYEEEVVQALLRHGVQNDVLVSSLIPESLRRVRALAPEIQTGISYPEDRHGASGKPYLAPLVKAALLVMRASLPLRVHSMIEQAQARGMMLHYQLVTQAVVKTVHARGGLLSVWTVDDPAQARRLAALGVDGIASNRPDIL